MRGLDEGAREGVVRVIVGDEGRVGCVAERAVRVEAEAEDGDGEDWARVCLRCERRVGMSTTCEYFTVAELTVAERAEWVGGRRYVEGKYSPFTFRSFVRSFDRSIERRSGPPTNRIPPGYLVWYVCRCVCPRDANPSHKAAGNADVAARGE